MRLEAIAIRLEAIACTPRTFFHCLSWLVVGGAPIHRSPVVFGF